MIEDEQVGPFWERVGRTISTYLDDDVEGVFLYLECGHAIIGGQMYRERPADIEQVFTPDALLDLVLKHWETLPPEKQWSAVRFSIKGGRFNVVFDYTAATASDQIDETRGTLDSMLVVVREHYSNKPIRPITDEEWKGSIRPVQ